MKILVISDTHGRIKKAEEVIGLYRGNINKVIHLGDITEDVENLKHIYNDVDFYNVAGNNDYGSDRPYDDMIFLNGRRILITHGHRHGVNGGLLRLCLWADEKNADIVIFGHTHVPAYEMYNGIIAVNPGSLSLPRSTSFPTFGILNLEDCGINDFIVYEYLGQGKVRRLESF